MARPLRIEYAGAFCHVMNRGQWRRNIFLDDKGRQNFADLLADTAHLWKVRTSADLLVTTPAEGLSRAMRHLDGIYTQRFNLAHRRDGPLFRGRYKAILIDAEENFLSVAGYMHKKQCPEWLDRRSVMSRFDGLKEYQRFMHDGIEEEIIKFYRGP